MENAAEALKMAGFTLLFVTALSVAMMTVMQAKNTSETIISYSDKTKYYSYVEQDSERTDSNGNRIVTLYDIIPTLYRYKQEGYIILFYDNNGTDPYYVYDGIDSSGSIQKFSFFNYYLEDKLQVSWRNNIEEHVKNSINYMLNKGSNQNIKFIEKVGTTTNRYLNNMKINNSDEQNSNSEQATEKKEIRVITYTVTN